MKEESSKYSGESFREEVSTASSKTEGESLDKNAENNSESSQFSAEEKAEERKILQIRMQGMAVGEHSLRSIGQ